MATATAARLTGRLKPAAASAPRTRSTRSSSEPEGTALHRYSSTASSTSGGASPAMRARTRVAPPTSSTCAKQARSRMRRPSLAYSVTAQETPSSTRAVTGPTGAMR